MNGGDNPLFLRAFRLHCRTGLLCARTLQPLCLWRCRNRRSQRYSIFILRRERSVHDPLSQSLRTIPSI